MQTSGYEEDFNLSTTAGLFSSAVTTSFELYNDTTIYTIRNDTNVTSTPLSSATVSAALVTRHGVVRGGSSAVFTGVIVSVVSCAVILLVVIPLIIWRCRSVRAQITASAPVSPDADKYGCVCLFVLFRRC